jgi:tetratricopeptide (TPR) repeat protein
MSSAASRESGGGPPQGSAAAPAAVAAASPWLYGPGSDLMLGAGLVYLLFLGGLWFFGASIETLLPASLMPLYALAFSTPHVGATLLRVYERREDRQKYRLFAVHMTAVLALAFVVGLYGGWVGSVMISLYLTIVPWHFTAQNYGVAMVFLRRRGIELDPGVKRFIYLTFILCFAATVVSLHGTTASEGYAPLETSGTVYTFLTLGIPPQLASLLIAGMMIGYVACAAVAAEQLLRRYPVRDLLPLAAVMLVQALWYVLPLTFAFFPADARTDPLAPHRFAYTFFWVSIAHSLQYLWITAYMRRRRRSEGGPDGFLLKALLAGAAIYGIPVLLLAPGALGTVPYDSGLFLIIAGALNLHHVLLDSAIWKLRDGRLARVLLRPSEDAAEVSSSRSKLVPRLVWAAGCVGAVFIVVGTLELYVAVPAAIERGDLARLETAANRLTWIGRDNPLVLASVGTLRAERGDREGAVSALRDSVNLMPTGPALLNLGSVLEAEGRLDEALGAYRTAVGLDLDSDVARLRAKKLRRKMGRGEAGADST